MGDLGSLSYLENLTEVANGHRLRPLAEEENLDLNDRQERVYNNQAGGLVRSILLRLVNETFLSLPIVECRHIYNADLTQQPHVHDVHDEHVDTGQAQQHVYDACFVNWTQAKLVQEPTSSTIANTEKYELLLSNVLTNSRQLVIDNFTEQNNHYRDPNIVNSTATPSGALLLDEYNLAKLTYLSLSSLLSICGLLVNFLIILIIIVNARQKTSSVVRSSSNTGHNNLLLAQLTITGFLIGSYVLVDNIYIHKQSNQPPLSQWPPNYRDRFSFCQLTANPPSPLTTFLPPTPFVTPRLPCSVSEDNRDCLLEEGVYLSDKGSGTQKPLAENQNLRTGTSRALIFTFTNSESSNEISRLPKSSFLKSTYEGTSSYIDLSDRLTSVFPANYECRADTSPQKLQTSDEKGQTDFNFLNFVSDHSGYTNQEQDCKIFGWFASGLLSLLMNVIASVHFWTAAALAYDRYSAIAHPLQYLRPIHASRTRIFLILSWTLSLILNLLFPITLTHLNNRVLWTSQNSYATKVDSSSVERLETWTDFDQSMRLSDANDYEAEEMPKVKTDKCQFTSISSANQYVLNGISGVEALLKLQEPWFDVESWLKEKKRESSTFEKKFLSNQNQQQKQDVQVDFISLLIRWAVNTSSAYAELKGQPKENKNPQKGEDNIYVALMLTFSLFSFVVVILVPLLLITLCNISIYRIVKVHERRISFSSVNNVTSVSAGSMPQQRNTKRDYNDNKSDAGSITSIIKAKLKFRRTTSHQELTSNLEPHQTCLPKHRRQYREKVAHQSKNEGNMVNRSKRLVVRQDSYKILEKLKNSDKLSQAMKFEENSNYNMNIRQDSTSCESMQPDLESRGCPLKTKIPDISQSGHKHTTISHQFHEHSNNKQHDVKTCSYGDLNLDFNQENMMRDSSFLKQLKMVGLSFVGIAVQEPLNPSNSKMLNRSTSCSFASLHSSNHQHWNRNQCYSSLSKSSIENSNNLHCEKKTYLTLDTTASSKQDATSNLSSQKLFDSESITTPQLSDYSASYQPIHIRLPMTIRTKSATFNLVFWLILTMLILTLPHYLLVTIDQIVKLNTTNGIGGRFAHIKSYKSSLYDYHTHDTSLHIHDSNHLRGSTRSQQDIHQTLLHFSSIWISCICRILFLSMVPLNAWLYGIRSRTLRIKIGMVFKRYISRRQASIEINQRQRSISSARSRESSSINIQHAHFLNRAGCSHCHLNVENNNRLFDRCLDFKEADRGSNMEDQIRCESSPVIGTNQQDSEWHNNQSNVVGLKARSLCQSNNTIRFFLGDNTSVRLSETQKVATVPDCHSDCSAPAIIGANESQVPSMTPFSEQFSTNELYERSLIMDTPTSCKKNTKNQIDSRVVEDADQVSSTFNLGPCLIEFDRVREDTISPCCLDGDRKMSTDTISESLSSSLTCQTQASQTSCRKQECGQPNHQHSCGFERRSSQRRLSAFESIRNPTNTERTDENRRQIRKSFSGFTFMITDADQESRVIELNSAPEKENRDKENAVVQQEDVRLHQRKPKLANQPSNWWTKLKLNLSNLLLDATASILTDNFGTYTRKPMLKDHCNRCKFGPSDHNNTGCQDESKTSLLRTNSFEDRTSKSSYLERSRKSNRFQMRGSKTMNNIERSNQGQLAVGCHCHCHKHQPFHTDSGHDENQHNGANQSLIHLKPPNFLKIMFTSDNHPVPYLGPSALSPIKECSSNHSYASSQSSLNNQVQATTHVMQMDASNKSDPVAL